MIPRNPEQEYVPDWSIFINFSHHIVSAIQRSIFRHSPTSVVLKFEAFCRHTCSTLIKSVTVYKQTSKWQCFWKLNTCCLYFHILPLNMTLKQIFCSGWEQLKFYSIFEVIECAIIQWINTLVLCLIIVASFIRNSFLLGIFIYTNHTTTYVNIM